MGTNLTIYKLDKRESARGWNNP